MKECRYAFGLRVPLTGKPGISNEELRGPDETGMVFRWHDLPLHASP